MGLFSQQDHGVVLWKEVEGQWKAEILHRTLHSSAVMGVGGMYGKSLIVSVGADKRIIGFNTVHGREEFRYQLESKALGILPNPVDHNLFMVQTGYTFHLFHSQMDKCFLAICSVHQAVSINFLGIACIPLIFLSTNYLPI